MDTILLFSIFSKFYKKCTVNPPNKALGFIIESQDTPFSASIYRRTKWYEANVETYSYHGLGSIK